MGSPLIRKFSAEDRDWLVAQHGQIYARDEGFDETFGVLVAEIIDGFLADHDAERERGWIAQDGDTRLGSIFCVKLSDTTAKLRLFLLTPDARGKGLGYRLLETCMGFAKASGYTDMQLWTHESHKAACALYQRSGWELISSHPVQSFGQNLIEQSWTYRF
ncbi:GNAT family N-acetyltransferase [uncultured Roseobacter sp.]|uniref:GNAT family N-acetyltransferase n=1 Tax=uncultured Roseobacter sp. TaxID=114847 RepID=UPI002606332A|nr:GNAT family N-acetyltransferase [uncultured Roseobacter sp.]